MEIIIIILVITFVLLALIKILERVEKFPYKLNSTLVSKAELSFYKTLIKALPQELTVFSKVRVADVVSVKKNLNRSKWQTAFNVISCKHFDFIVCDKNNLSIKMAIELDDSSHSSIKAVKRDHFINGVCQACQLPLLRIKAASSYNIKDLNEKIISCLDISTTSPKTKTPIIKKPTSPKCPKCGNSMILRKSKTGENRGKEFWGCSSFPKCRGLVSVK